jgi:tRNA dimethylallyltransferase
MPNSLLITVLGPTASGKTAFAARLACSLEGEIISADSRQVYRKMDIGTGKDYSEYEVDGRKVPYHLIDIVDAGYQYSIFEYLRDFKNVWDDISRRGKQAILCGGSGMYIESVTSSYRLVDAPHDNLLRKKLETRTDNELREMLSSFRALHNVSDTSSRERLIRAVEIASQQADENRTPGIFPEPEILILGLRGDRDQRRKRITSRLDQRLKEGLIDEVKQLLEEGLTAEALMYYGLEYKFVTLYLTGNITFDQMRERLNTAIHQFAKRQMTWFRRMERNGYSINWMETGTNMEENLRAALAIISRHKTRLK